MNDFKITKSVKEALAYCERGSHEDQGDWHNDWDCYHMVIILDRSDKFLFVFEREVDYVLSCLENSADLCRDHDDPKLRRAAPKISKLYAEVRKYKDQI